MNLQLFLTLTSGICWTVVYEECIRLGFRQKTCCMPLWALALNFAWEALYSYCDVTAGEFGVQTIVNIIWCLLDVFILITWIRYAKDDCPEASIIGFGGWTALALIASFALQIVFVIQFPHGLDSECWSAFLQNLLMSVLFINQIVSRNSLRGTSLTLGIAKWIGTLAPTITLGILQPRPLVLIAGMLCSIFDIIYIAYILRLKKSNL